jgi:hypothetical protein
LVVHDDLGHIVECGPCAKAPTKSLLRIPFLTAKKTAELRSRPTALNINSAAFGTTVVIETNENVAALRR